jgi:hypothetical protein
VDVHLIKHHVIKTQESGGIRSTYTEVGGLRFSFIRFPPRPIYSGTGQSSNSLVFASTVNLGLGPYFYLFLDNIPVSNQGLLDNRRSLTTPFDFPGTESPLPHENLQSRSHRREEKNIS